MTPTRTPVLLVRLQAGVGGAEVGQRRRPREVHGVRVDAARADPVELVPAYPHLLELVGGHRLDPVGGARLGCRHAGLAHTSQATEPSPTRRS